MARAIVGYSLEGGQIQFRNRVRAGLLAAGFEDIGTSSYEAHDAPLDEIMAVLTSLVADLTGARLDHLWIYVDVAREP